VQLKKRGDGKSSSAGSYLIRLLQFLLHEIKKKKRVIQKTPHSSQCLSVMRAPNAPPGDTLDFKT